MCPQDAPMECSGTYTVEQTDMDSGVLDNTFTVSASSPNLPNQPDVGASKSATVDLPGTASATIGEQLARRPQGVEICACLHGRNPVLQQYFTLALPWEATVLFSSPSSQAWVDRQIPQAIFFCHQCYQIPGSERMANVLATSMSSPRHISCHRGVDRRRRQQRIRERRRTADAYLRGHQWRDHDAFKPLCHRRNVRRRLPRVSRVGQ